MAVMRKETIHKLNLHLGDCMEYMKSCKDNEFDLAIVDPPYGIGNWVQTTGNCNPSAEKVKWNDNTPTQEYFDELRRVSKEWICWGWNYYTEYLGSTNNIVFWDKHMGSTTYAAGELAGMSIKSQLKILDLPLLSQGTSRIHPCQKPVKLYQWLLTNYAEPNQKILDTHLGSGSSAIAAHYFGCDFTGIEIDEDYFNASLERINEQTKQMDLLGG